MIDTDVSNRDLLHILSKSILCLGHLTMSAKASFSGCPSAAFVHSIVNTISHERLDETYREYSLALTDDLISYWGSEVKGQGHSRPSRWRRQPRRSTLGRQSPSSNRFQFFPYFSRAGSYMGLVRLKPQGPGPNRGPDRGADRPVQ